jgi:hypothetical protein
VKWFEEQIARTDWGITPLSLALGASPNLADNNPHRLSRILHKGQQCTIGEAIALASLLNVGLRQVLEHLGYRWPRQKVPIIGSVRAGGDVTLRDDLGTHMAPAEAGGPALRAIQIDEPKSPLDKALMFFYLRKDRDPRVVNNRWAYMTFPPIVRDIPFVGRVQSLVSEERGIYKAVPLLETEAIEIRHIETASIAFVFTLSAD